MCKAKFTLTRLSITRIVIVVSGADNGAPATTSLKEAKMTTVSILSAVIAPLIAEYKEADMLEELGRNERFRNALMFASMGVEMPPADARNIVLTIQDEVNAEMMLW